MTTPNVTSPNVRIIERGRPVPEGAEPSETPLAELLLADFPRVRDHYAERDVLGALENVPVIITIAARAGWAALAQDISDATESGRLLLADWWRHAWTETFQRPAFWSAPASAPDPGAHPYPAPEAEPAAEPEGLVHWTPEEPDQPACDADVDAPASTAMLGTLNPARVTCPACQRITIDAAPEPAAGEPGPATDATAVPVDIAGKQEAAKEPDDATKVIDVGDAETTAVPAVKDEDGGEQS